jgi:2-polyprenyl-3-methyl-5-hydroxy-6-metoxy-1,4-benzoquinol methylase
MKPLDKLLQQWRISKARAHIPRGAHVLDIGCADGALFRQLADRIGSGVGIDPTLMSPVSGSNYRLVPGHFPHDLPAWDTFDAIAALAVMEHVPMGEQHAVASACFNLLKPGGQLIITVPSPIVDKMLHVLRALRLIDFGETHQHYGYDPRNTIPVFEAAGLKVSVARRFQFGANNLFVFQRPASLAPQQPAGLG